ncbi:MAG: hypothetical protein C4567_03605 [Deltaproteobacteria bacterium]|nr:MAG: hypothetical protein C4567_03605 [Deltaproteobacteria bacterium]
MTLPVKFDFTVKEDRRGINFEGLEAGHTNPEGALNLHVRVARDHVVLSVWPVKGEMAGISDSLAEVLGPPRDKPAVCGFGDCQDDDKDAPQQTTMWEFAPESREGVLAKVRGFLGL